MAIFHCEVKIGGRGNGKSAVASAAYRSGEKLQRDIDGKTKDFTRKQGVEHSEIFLPENAPAEYKDREKLWNAVEQNEKSKDAQYYREFEIALPHELNEKQQKELAQGFCRELARQGMCVDMSIHAKEYQREDGTTYKMRHAHCMATLRGIDKEGKWEKTKQKKIYALDQDGNKIPIMDEKTGKQAIGERGRKLWKRVTVKSNPWDTKEALEGWRQTWEQMTNKALERAGSKSRVSRLSYKARGINRIPQIKLGPAATAIEKRSPGTSWKVAKNNERIALNRAFQQLEKDERQLKFMDAAAGKAKATAKAGTAAQKTGGAVKKLGKVLDKTANDIIKATPAPSAAPVKEENTPWSALTKSAQLEKMADHRFDEDWDDDEGQSLKGNVSYIAPEEGQKRTKKDEDEQSARKEEKPAQNRSNEPQEVKDAKEAVRNGADRQTLERHLKKLGDLQEKQWGIIQKEAEAAESQAMQAHFSQTGNAAEALKVGQAAKAAEVKTPTSPAGIAAAAVVAVVQGAITIIETALKIMDESNEATQGVQEQQAGLARVLSRMDEPQR